MTELLFVYLDVGSRKSAHLRKGELGIELELQYSISTLRADRSAEHRFVIYTDRPETYRLYAGDVVDLSCVQPPELQDLSYIYRAKPAVLLHALREHGGPCIFIDSDTFVQEGFSLQVKTMIEDGAILWDVTPTPPHSHFPKDIPPCPHSADHKPSAVARPFGNSGVIGLKPGWGEAILEAALPVIDVMRASGNRDRTLEQTAIFEAVWLNGVDALDIKPWIEHYCTNSSKRYMHWLIKRLIDKHGGPLPPLKPMIKLSPARVKMYQYFWDVKRQFLSRYRHG